MHTCNTLHTGHTVLIHYCLTVAHVLDGLIAHIIKQCATKLQLNSSTDERGGAASEAANLASHELQPSQAAHNHDSLSGIHTGNFTLPTSGKINPNGPELT